MTCVASELREYLHRSMHERLGVGEPVDGLKRVREIVEHDSYRRMVLPQAVLVDFESAAHERFGLAPPVGRVKECCQVAEHDRYHGVIFPRTSLLDVQRAPKQLFGLGEPVRGLK